MRLARSRLAASLVALALAACSRPPAPATPAGLRRAVERAPALEVQVRGRLLEANRGALPLEVLAARSGKEVRLGGVGDAGDPAVPRVVLGTVDQPEVARLFERLGGRLEPHPAIGELELRRKSDRLVLCAEDPDRPGLPLTLHLAGQLGIVALLLEDLSPATRPGATLLAADAPLRTDGDGALAPAGAPLEPLARGRAVRLLADAAVDPARGLRYLEQADAAVDAVARWAGARPERELELQGLGTAAALRGLAGRCALAVDDGLPLRRRVLLAGGVPDDAGACAARWAAAATLGAPAEHWMLDGAAIDAADSWWGRPLEAWCGELAAAGLLPAPATLIDAAAVDRLSQHLLAPARGLLWRHRGGGGGVVGAGALGGGARAPALDAAAFLARAPSGAAGPRGDRRAALAGDPFHVGVALDSTTRPGGAYDDGAALARSLAEARELGVGALSITATGSLLPAPPPPPGGRVAAGVEVLEGDAAVAQAVAAARGAGFARVLLQVQVLASPSAGHAAWMRRTTTAHWDEFFEGYQPALLHQALLAELLGVDVLCVGTALSTDVANGGLVVDTKVHHDRMWAESIELARRAFGGPLTYAARAGGEVERCAHWPHLDLVGASFFPDLGPRDGPPVGEAELVRRWSVHLERLEAVARREGKPALVVEAGVRSTAGGAGETRLGPGPLDLEVQAAAWRALAGAVRERRAASGTPWLAGLVAWKWTASPTGGGTGDRGYALTGKPAAASLRALAGEDG